MSSNYSLYLVHDLKNSSMPHKTLPQNLKRLCFEFFDSVSLSGKCLSTQRQFKMSSMQVYTTHQYEAYT